MTAFQERLRILQFSIPINKILQRAIRRKTGYALASPETRHRCFRRVHPSVKRSIPYYFRKCKGFWKKNMSFFHFFIFKRRFICRFQHFFQKLEKMVECAVKNIVIWEHAAKTKPCYCRMPRPWIRTPKDILPSPIASGCHQGNPEQKDPLFNNYMRTRACAR